jgi:hypothetical protein
MIINSTYLTRWKDISERRRAQTRKNNAQENRSRLTHRYHPNDLIYLSNNDVKRKLLPREGPYKILAVYTNGTMKIQRSPTVSEVVNIRRVHPAFSCSN